MSKTIAQLKQDLEGMGHGTTLNKVKNFYTLVWRAANNMQSRINIRGTRRVANLTNAIYDDIYDYALPSDVKEVIDIRPQANRDESDNLRQQLAKEFDMYKGKTTDYFQIKHNDGIRSIRITKDLSPNPVTISDMNSLTDNGTWSDDGTVCDNIAKEELYYITASAAIKLNFIAIGSGYIQNTTLTVVDLTDYDEKGSFFLRVYLPDSSKTTAIALTWGNDLTANYWNKSVTTQHDGTAFRNGWNLLRFDWNGATETGTVDPATIDSVKITFTVAGTDTDIVVDYLSCSLGYIFEIEYYSEYLFRSSSGTFKEYPTDDTDILNLETDACNILTYECLMEIAQQLQGSDSSFDITFAKDKLFGNTQNKGLYGLYLEKYPDEAEPVISYYYK